MKSCDNCLFYVDALPGIVICVGHKRVKEYSYIKENCKYWVENTPENATMELKKLEKQ